MRINQYYVISLTQSRTEGEKLNKKEIKKTELMDVDNSVVIGLGVSSVEGIEEKYDDGKNR